MINLSSFPRRIPVQKDFLSFLVEYDKNNTYFTLTKNPFD